MNKKYSGLWALICFSIIGNTAVCQQADSKTNRQLYQIKIYHFDTDEQQQRTDNFLKTAYLPALHEAGISKVGVWQPIKPDTSDLKTYVLIPFDSWQAFDQLEEKIKEDSDYRTNGKDFLQASHDNPPFARMESILLRAFPEAPAIMDSQLDTPKSNRVYELRSYESPTPALNENKVEMFNAGGEVALFNRLNFNPIFYANVISGSHMPNLMYMISFSSMESRETHWKSFGNDSTWKKLSSMEKYQDNVSHIDNYFLKATDYSDL